MSGSGRDDELGFFLAFLPGKDSSGTQFMTQNAECADRGRVATEDQRAERNGDEPFPDQRSHFGGR